jgi:hypothetical protein
MAELDSVWVAAEKAGQGASGFACLAVAFGIGGWAFPPLVKTLGDPVILVLLLIAFSGVALVFYLLVFLKLDSTRRSLDGALASPFTLEPVRFLAFLTNGPTWTSLGICASALTGFVVAVAGALGTGGWSQNPAWTISLCKWSVGKNHGATNVCVSHAHWLATGQQFDRTAIGFLAVFLSIEAAIFLGVTSRVKARG